MSLFNRLFFNSPPATSTVMVNDCNNIHRSSSNFVVITLFTVFLLLVSNGNVISQPKQANPSARWWSDATESALVQAGTNRPELIKALNLASRGQREGMQFLIENMPQWDLKTLTSDFLIDNLTMAYKGWQEAPWGITIPTDIFLNDILPYVSVSEPRDNWRKRISEISLPLIKGCKTPSEACKALNEQIFKLLKVKYSKKRRAPDQGPFETMETGVATCTGLSILLVDACRSVGIPARVAGTPLWSNESGNHTWVEVWDGDWLFTGAAEQNPQGFNRGWFVSNASQAIKDDPKKAIYASSFKKTGLSFPMVWARDVDYVNAINVSDRYTAKVKPIIIPGLRLMLDVFDRPVGERVASKVTITDASNPLIKFDGISKGDAADMNDHLFFQLPKQRTYVVDTERKGQKFHQYYTAGIAAEDKFPVYLSGIPPVAATSRTFYTPPPAVKSIKGKDEAKLKEAFTAFYIATPSQQSKWKFSGGLEKLLKNNEPAVRKIAWDAYMKAPIHDSLKVNFEANKVRFEKHVSPYTVKTVGTRPANGWPLFIAMHGGGGAPQELNDSQWRHMQIYYRDHPEMGGYIYVALRAPDNSWNGFYTGYAYPLMQNLLRQFMLFGDVDPNKKFIMGYSHGGYGAYAMGPKMPDYFAGIQASAAALADGASPITLRNTAFSTMVGEKDTMYGRSKHIVDFKNEIEKLRGDRTDIYPITVQIIANHPHSGLPDRDKIADLYPNVRNPVPLELTWRLSDKVIHDFFWLHVPTPESGKDFNVTCKNNHLTATTNLTAGSVLLDSRLIDFTRPVTLELNGKTSKHKLKPSLHTLCETMLSRGDPELAFTAELPLKLK
ncbi:MAG: transglutaminase domain-containing protein [Mariniphaga sp.]